MSEQQMKGITVCADCAYYILKKHKCSRGCTDEGKPTDHFYVDCPLPDVEPVRHALWLWYKSGNFNCSACGYEIFSDRDRTPYCPHCGCVMERMGE